MLKSIKLWETNKMTENLEQKRQIEDKETQPKKQSFICACSEGEERSVLASRLLKEAGYTSTILPGGLEGLEEYLTGDETASTLRMERAFARGVTSAFALRGKNYNRTYDSILRKADTWLLFIGAGIEAGKFKKLIKILKSQYDKNIVVLNSYNQQSVTEQINKFLESKS